MTKSIIIRTSCSWQEVFDMKELHMTRRKIEKKKYAKKIEG
jgi:hypothetical protein